jgi:glycosyltransferase involved in cell wall biosynthesis
MKVTVVVPCFNAERTIARQLDALAQQSTQPWEVIVADNGSTDRSVDVASTYASRLARFRIVEASAKQGASHARNVGAAAATGDVLAFCDADDEVAPGWIAGLQKALANADFVASRFDHGKLNPPSSYVHPQTTGLIQDEKFDFLPRAGGCGLAVRRSVHDAVGGFDESIRYHEDTDYCWKIQLAGTPLGYASDAVVHVQNRQHPGERFRQARGWAASQVALYKKYRRMGMPRSSNKEAFREWLAMPRAMFQVARGRASAENLYWRLGTRLGRLQGSLVFLVLFL